MAVETSSLRTALVSDAGFIGRLQSLMATIAVQVLNENPGTAPRKAYASKVLNGPRAAATSAAPYLVLTDNFVGQPITIEPLGSGFAVTTATTDADALSQIFTVWDSLVTLFGSPGPAEPGP